MASLMMLLGIAFAALAAQEERVQAPAGEENFQVITTSPRWKGITFRAGHFGGTGLRMDVSNPTESRNDGITPEFRVTLELDEKDIDAVSAGFVVDFELFRLSFDVLYGDWQGEGDLIISDGVNPETTTPVDVEGDFWGLHFGLHWPGLHGRTGILEASLGPQLSVGWQHETIDRLPQAPLPVHDDEVNELVGRLGLRLGVRLHLGRGAWFSLEGEGAFQGGSSKGFVHDLSAGFGFLF